MCQSNIVHPEEKKTIMIRTVIVNLLKEAKTKVVIKHNVVSSTCKVFMFIHDLPGTFSATHVIVLIPSIRVVQGFRL